LRHAALLALTGLAAACAEERPAPMPTPAPPAATDRGGLRPLSSRDGAPPPQQQGSPQAMPPFQPLPPGHPPIEGGELGAFGGEAVSGTVTLAPSLASRASAARALFIVARNAATQQILAVRKEDGVRFPFAFSISGADAMTAGTAFAGPFDITARLSKSGDAIPAAGDVEGVAKGVKAGATKVRIELDSVRQ
jgi:cytochrome c-type biogenesis protein CcmH